MPAQGPEIALVHGGVGVLLRVEHPHQQIDHRDQQVHLQAVVELDGVVVGKVEQDEPGERPIDAVVTTTGPGRADRTVRAL